jgi:transcriptional regulator with XRE-family HTH domain
MENDKGRFPNKLKLLRHSSGYSQKKVARILGYADTSMLSKWEHGKVLPSIVQAFRLSRIYRTIPHELFNGLWHHFDAEDDLLTQEESFNSNQSFSI